LRVVLDATVLVRAHPRSASTARKLLVALLAGSHTPVLSNAIIAETIRVLRYPRLQKLHALSEEELYGYAQFLRDVSDMVVIGPHYHAPLRDAHDLDVMQTEECGVADVLCSNDGDFHDKEILQYCAARGIDVCTESSLLRRLTSG
jgi:putative PIN family toxin of toxin-antitoxin system